MTFYDVFLKLCTQRGIKPGTAAKKIPISKSIITRWKSGKGNPTDATLAKIAAYFECSIEDLRFDKEKTTAPEGSGDSKIIQFMMGLPKDVLRGILLGLGAPTDVLAELDQQEHQE